jgi:hypothetical protein
VGPFSGQIRLEAEESHDAAEEEAEAHDVVVSSLSK